jgi:hypothetical protein
LKQRKTCFFMYFQIVGKELRVEIAKPKTQNHAVSKRAHYQLELGKKRTCILAHKLAFPNGLVCKQTPAFPPIPHNLQPQRNPFLSQSIPTLQPAPTTRSALARYIQTIQPSTWAPNLVLTPLAIAPRCTLTQLVHQPHRFYAEPTHRVGSRAGAQAPRLA